MAKRKMRKGECRTTKNGVTYCMTAKGVRFRGGRGRGRLSGSRKRKSGTKGKKCIRFQLVHVKGVRGTQRRCKKFG